MRMATEVEEHLLEAVKLAYRKHHLGDDSIGWAELNSVLLDALCFAMGEEGYLEWKVSIARRLFMSLQEDKSVLMSPDDSTEHGAEVVWYQQRKWGGKQSVSAKFIELRGKQSVRIAVDGKEHTVNKKNVYLKTGEGE